MIHAVEESGDAHASSHCGTGCGRQAQTLSVILRGSLQVLLGGLLAGLREVHDDREGLLYRSL